MGHFAHTVHAKIQRSMSVPLRSEVRTFVRQDLIARLHSRSQGHRNGVLDGGADKSPHRKHVVPHSLLGTSASPSIFKRFQTNCTIASWTWTSFYRQRRPYYKLSKSQTTRFRMCRSYGLLCLNLKSSRFWNLFSG